jgi:hypothetical protein
MMRIDFAWVMTFVVGSMMGCGATPMAAPDAATVPIDSGPRPDAYVAPIDAGPPVCVGTAMRCADRPTAQCDAATGCSVQRCIGTPDACDLHFDSTDCYRDHGCAWSSGSQCQGEPDECSTYTSDTACIGAGCSWPLIPQCGGTATPCTELSAATCALAPGCMLAIDAGPPDSGADAATHDAGAADAGMHCAPSGSCHPLYDAACGCGYSATTFDWACGRAGTAAAGGNCTTSADCRAGLICSRRTMAASGQCRQLCDADADCGTAEGCAQIGHIAISCTGYCLPLAGCNIDAPTCAAGQVCYYLVDGARGFEFCNRAGTAAGGASCLGDPTACMPSYVCGNSLGDPMYDRCHHVCGRTPFDCAAVGTETCVGRTPSGHMYCL